MITIHGLTARLLLSSLVFAATSVRGEGVYDSAQVAAGKSAYDRYCVECHHGSLRGTGHGPALSGSEFVGRWANLSAGELVAFIRSSMATTVPASAGERVFADMAAYILSVNQFSVGSRPLSSAERAASDKPQRGDAVSAATTARSETEEGGARRAWEGAGGVAEAAARAGRWLNQSTPLLSKVTDEMLRNPPESAWLNWRRTQDGQGFSPQRNQWRQRSQSSTRLVHHHARR